METEQAILQRRSIRRYIDKSIDKRILEKILKAGFWAPSASNQQAWAFICVTDSDIIQDIETVSAGLSGSPSAIICICSDRVKAARKSGGEDSETVQFDCAMAAQNMMLRAMDFGLGSCVIASTNKNAVGLLLDTPEHLKVELLVTLGYHEVNPKAPVRDESAVYWECCSE